MSLRPRTRSERGTQPVAGIPNPFLYDWRQKLLDTCKNENKGSKGSGDGGGGGGGSLAQEEKIKEITTKLTKTEDLLQKSEEDSKRKQQELTAVRKELKDAELKSAEAEEAAKNAERELQRAKASTPSVESSETVARLETELAEAKRLANLEKAKSTDIAKQLEKAEADDERDKQQIKALQEDKKLSDEALDKLTQSELVNLAAELKRDLGQALGDLKRLRLESGEIEEAPEERENRLLTEQQQALFEYALLRGDDAKFKKLSVKERGEYTLKVRLTAVILPTDQFTDVYAALTTLMLDTPIDELDEKVKNTLASKLPGGPNLENLSKFYDPIFIGSLESFQIAFGELLDNGDPGSRFENVKQKYEAQLKKEKDRLRAVEEKREQQRLSLIKQEENRRLRVEEDRKNKEVYEAWIPTWNTTYKFAKELADLKKTRNLNNFDKSVYESKLGALMARQISEDTELNDRIKAAAERWHGRLELYEILVKDIVEIEQLVSEKKQDKIGAKYFESMGLNTMIEVEIRGMMHWLSKASKADRDEVAMIENFRGRLSAQLGKRLEKPVAVKPLPKQSGPRRRMTINPITGEREELPPDPPKPPPLPSGGPGAPGAPPPPPRTACALELLLLE